MSEVLPAGADLYLRLRTLASGGGVLHLGAHPDDEDTALIAYLARGRAVPTVYWSATRGEGGQNRVGSERGEALGLLRTWESAAARQVDGGQLLYGPFYDFGYARTGEQALAAWGRAALVGEVVRAIRTVQPDVVVSRWTGGPADGHGQHRAIGAVAREAFDRAADPASFPGMGLPPWQALKLYTCVVADWQPGEDAADTDAGHHDDDRVVRLDLGAYDGALGRTYRELGSLAQNRHRSQAMTVVPAPGPFVSCYRLVRSRVGSSGRERDLSEGTDPTLRGLADRAGEGLGAQLRPLLTAAGEAVAQAVTAYRPDDPAAAGERLLEGVDALAAAVGLLREGSPGGPHVAALVRWLERRVGSFEAVIASCLGVHLSCLPDRVRVTPGGALETTTQLWNLGPRDVQVRAVTLDVPDGWGLRRLKSARAEKSGDAVASAVDAVEVPRSAPASSPHWLVEPREGARYRCQPGAAVGVAFDPPPVAAHCVIEVDGHRVRLRADAIRDEASEGAVVAWPVGVLPPVSVRPRRRLELLPAGGERRRVGVDVEVRHLAGPASRGTVRIDLPAGWQAVPDSASLSLHGQRDARTVRFEVDVPAGAPEGTHALTLSYVSDDGARSAATASTVRAPAQVPGCPPEQTVVSPAMVSVQLVAVEFVRSLRYGFLRGADDELPDVLDGFGLHLAELSDDDLAYADLGRYDAIIVGPNAYLMREGVRRAAGRLLDHVHAGGTLIVQHQSYGYQDLAAAPYPLAFTQPHGRVATPDAPVEILAPDHPLLTTPNRIGPEDFAGWLQDRGRYFLGEWDRRYVPLLSSADPGEPAQRGGLVVAGYGHGTFAYVAYSLYRQVAAGIPGAVRLMANLLGLAEARIRERMDAARRAPLLASMTDAQLHDVARVMSERWYDDHAILCREGDREDELYIVTAGEVEVVRSRPGDRDEIVYVARAGEATGELAVLADVARAATLRARGEVRVLAMRGADFRALLAVHPEMAQAVIRTLALRLAGVRDGP